MTAAAKRDVYPCDSCGKPYLDGYPHRHHREAIAWDAMPPRPERLYCGPLDVNAYWTGAEWRPGCCLVHAAVAEYRNELPEHLHPIHASSVTGLVPIPRMAQRLDGPMIDVPDTGPLGGWPWAARAHRRFGGVTMLAGEQTLDAGDYRAFPWAYAIERRLAGYCRKRHLTRPDLWHEHRGELICPRIARLVIAYGLPPEDLAGRRILPADRVRPVLEDVLPWLWRRVSEAVNQLELRR